MSTPTTHNRKLHRFAQATPIVALVTLVMVALVSSKNAGMAFRDWQTSDGQAMLSYPWLADFAKDWDKFLEHGHRLAGVVIGMWSIALVGFVGAFEERSWVKGLTFGILLGVIAQGVLGGFRVWFDQRGLALMHGAFAAVVFSLMAATATVLSSRWQTAAADSKNTNPGPILPFAIGTLVLLSVQYLAGGFIRHQGTALNSHFSLGILSLIVVLLNTFIAHRSGLSWVRRSGWMLQLAVLLQVMLGLGTWVAKWGFTPTGYVAVADSIGQVATRTSHMVVGALVMSAATVHLVRTLRVLHVTPRRAESPILFPTQTTTSPIIGGGTT